MRAECGRDNDKREERGEREVNKDMKVCLDAAECGVYQLGAETRCSRAEGV